MNQIQKKTKTNKLFDYFRCISPFPKRDTWLDEHYEVVGQLWSARARIAILEKYVKLLESEVKQKYGR